MAAFQIVFRTSGQVSAVVATTAENRAFSTNKVSRVFANTTNDKPVFKTNSVCSVFAQTVKDAPIFKSSNLVQVFLGLPVVAPKQLVLKTGVLEFATDYSVLTVPDNTGIYNPALPNENPGGYNPESASTNPYRPKRSQVKLWTIYNIYTEENKSTRFPDLATQLANENQVNYDFPLTIPTVTVNGETDIIRGLYKIALLAVPLSKNYADAIGVNDLIENAESYPDYYVTVANIMVNPDVINCLNQKRYKYLQGVMCGSCSDDYLEFYSIYVAMLSALEINDMDAATEFYNKLVTICNESLCKSCNCFACDC